MRALIVEPNLNLQRELVAALRMADLEVLAARSAQQAHELARVARIHVILVDAALEADSGGLYLIEELRQKGRLGPTTTLLVLDTAHEPRHEHAAGELGADAYLVKPFSQSDLLTLLARTLSRKSTLRPLQEALALRNMPTVLSLADKLLRQAPQFEREVVTAKADALVALQRLDEAEELFDVSANANPEAAWPRLGAAQVALAAGRVSDALAYLKPPLPPHPELLPAYDLLARAHIMRGAYRHAQQMLRAAAQLSPLNLSRLRELIRLALLNRDARVANEAGSQLVRRGKNSAQFSPADFINVVRCAVLLERPGIATELVKTAHSRFPDNPDLAVLRHLADAHDSLSADHIAHAQRFADQGRRLTIEVTEPRKPPRLTSDIATPEIVLAGIETCMRTGLPLSGLGLVEALREAQQSDRMQLTHLDDLLLTRYQTELVTTTQHTKSDVPPPKPKNRWDRFLDWLETPVW